MTSAQLAIKRRQSRRKYSRTGLPRVGRWFATSLLIFAALNYAVALAGFGTIVSAFAVYSDDLPAPGTLSVSASSSIPTRLYDRTGQQLLYEISDPRQANDSWVSLSSIPVDLRNATIAMEDPTFLTDTADDVPGIFRIVSNLLTDSHNAGFRPSITQRLVESIFAEQPKTGSEGKLKEFVLTVRLSQNYSKDKILEWYLNTHWYGSSVYGVQDASQVYFGKAVGDLSLAEAATIVGMMAQPDIDPVNDYDAVRQHQSVVLKTMVDQGYISSDRAAEALAAPVVLKLPEPRSDLVAPHFALAAQRQLEALVGRELVRRGGLVVYTTLDYPLYLQTQCVARTQLARLSGQRGDVVVPPDDGSSCLAAKYLQPLPTSILSAGHHASNAAVVIIDARTGEVLSLLGSLDYYNLAIDGNVNTAFLGREPGAAIQPFAYLTAFQQGYTPATMMLDIRTSFDLGSGQSFVPDNIDHQFHGPMSIRTALANSVNIPAVQIMNWTGTDNVLHTAHAMGINSLRSDSAPFSPELAVKGGNVTLADLAYAYSVLANGGVMRGTPASTGSNLLGYRTLDPTLILRVEDQAGNILWEYGKGDTFGSSTILEPGLSYLVTNILADAEARQPSIGGSGPFQIDRPAAVMPGTSEDMRDTWAIGYTPQLATGVWVGNTDGGPMIDLPASAAAAPIWQAVMRYAHLSLPIEKWERPSDIIEIAVCDPSGLLPTLYCPTRPEVFKSGTQPTVPDNMFQQFAINVETGHLATVYTPPGLIEQRIFEVVPPEAADWALGAGIAQPPTVYDSIDIPPTTGDVTIVEPAAFSYVRGELQINGNARDPAFRTYRLDYGAGLYPGQWFQIGSDSSSPASSGLLGVWNTNGLDGLYSLRLTLVRTDSSFEQTIIQLTVDNVAPSIRLALPSDGQVFALSDKFVAMQPIVDDNVSMDRVEFYVDGSLVATSTTAPFANRWGTTSAGTHTIQARAYDSAGNMASTQNVSIIVNP